MSKHTSNLTDSELQSLAARLGLQNQQSITALQYSLDNIILFDQKHSDYGHNNITVIGTVGVTYRIFEKATRLINLLSSKRRARNESRRDSYRDISVLALIATMTHDDKWLHHEARICSPDQTRVPRPATVSPTKPIVPSLAPTPTPSRPDHGDVTVSP